MIPVVQWREKNGLRYLQQWRLFCGVRKKPPQNLLLNWRHSSNITKTLEKNCHFISTKDNFEIEEVLFNLTVLSCYTLPLSNELDLRRNFNYSGCWFQAYSDQPLHLLNRLYSIRYSPLVLLHRCKCKFFQQRTHLHLYLALHSPPPSFSRKPQGNVPMQNHVRHFSHVQEILKSFLFCNKSPKSTLRHSQSSAAIATYGVRGINVKYKRGMQCKRQSKVQ